MLQPAIYRPPSTQFYDLTKQRHETNKKVQESFNNMDTMLKELRRIAEYEGAMSKINKSLKNY